MDESQLGRQTSQENSQEKPSSETQDKKAKTPTESKEELKYTQTQYSKMQSSLRTENQTLKDRVAELEVELATAEGQVEDTQVLKEMVAKLHGEIEDGLPEDGKEAANKYLRKLATITESEVRQGKEYRRLESKLKGYEKEELEEEAQKLATKHGIELNELLVFSDVRDMKAYALDHQTKQVVQAETAGDVEKTEPAERPLASPLSAGGATDKSHYAPHDWIREGLAEAQKKK